MKLSVVVPTLNEANVISGQLVALQPLRFVGHEIILADGESSDSTTQIAREFVDCIVQTRPGRAAQMNAGAARASGDVLLFLHADTQLPENADQLIANALRDSGCAWGRFDVAIDGDHFMFPVIGTLMNWRSRLTGIATGDQAMFLTRAVFDRVGGFPNLALMEDIAMSRLLKRQSAPVCLSATVRTSGRRWLRHGVLRTVVSMWRLRLQFALGVSDQTLAREYPNHDQ